MDEQKLRQLFKNRSNCYADSDEVIPAMDEDCFIETVKEALRLFAVIRRSEQLPCKHKQVELVRVKDLPENASLYGVKVKLPTHIYEASSLPAYDIKNVPVYLQGWLMGDFFVKTSLESTQVYPMFWESIPPEMKEWEVVQ